MAALLIVEDLDVVEEVALRLARAVKGLAGLDRVENQLSMTALSTQSPLRLGGALRAVSGVPDAPDADVHERPGEVG